MEKQFLIKWEIDIFAESIEEAIAKAIKYMPVSINNSTATVFNVSEIKKDGIIRHGDIDAVEFLK